jgi:hypothetical protein
MKVERASRRQHTADLDQAITDESSILPMRGPHVFKRKDAASVSRT